MHALLWLLVVLEGVGLITVSIRQREVNLYLARVCDDLEEKLRLQTERGDRTAWRLRNVEDQAGFVAYEDPVDPFMPGGMADKLNVINRQSRSPAR